MISILRRKNDFEIRQNILRGVYEENRIILGKGRPVLSRRRPFALKRFFLPAAVCLFVFLMYGQDMGTSSPPVERTVPVSKATFTSPAVVAFSEGTSTSDFSSFADGGKFPLSRMLGLSIRTIMIDAGHGGTDPGTIGKMGTMEKDVTLDIAKRLKAHLVKSGRHPVRMTREDDSFVSLQKRVVFAREARADLFISIHVNHLPNKPINMIETYYFGPSNDEKTLKLAEQENAGSEYGLSDFKEVLEKLGKTMKLQESKELAESIQANLFLNSRKHSEDIKDYGVKRAPFVVLLGVDVPSVLAEVSCLSNQDEERELNFETHRENIATYLGAGIFHYLNKGAFTYEAKR